MGKLPLYFNSLLALPTPLTTTENPTGNFYLVSRYLCTNPFICNKYIYIWVFLGTKDVNMSINFHYSFISPLLCCFSRT